MAGPLAGALLLCACAPAVQDQYENARKAFAAHDYVAARIALAAGLKAHPEKPEYLVLLARTQIRLEDGEGAIVSLRRLEQLGKLPPDGAILMGDAALLRGRYEEALAAVANDGTAEAARIRGLALIGAERAEEADTAFAAGLHASGPKLALLGAYAGYRLGEKDFDPARRLAEQALAIDGEDLSALRVMGAVAAMSGDSRGSLAIADRVLALYPNDLPALFGKIEALSNLRRVREIAPLIERAAKIAPDHPRLAFYQALLAAEKRDWASARKILQPLERNLDNEPDLQFLYAKALFHLGQVEQARAHLSPLLLRQPDNDDVRIMLAKCQIAGQDLPNALETLRPFADRNDASSDELALLADVAKKAGDPMQEVYAGMAQAAATRHMAAR